MTGLTRPRRGRLVVPTGRRGGDGLTRDPPPVIAAVHGVAFGGAFQLSLGADMRFVGSRAQLSVMEISGAWSPT